MPCLRELFNTAIIFRVVVGALSIKQAGFKEVTLAFTVKSVH